MVHWWFTLDLYWIYIDLPLIYPWFTYFSDADFPLVQRPVRLVTGSQSWWSNLSGDDMLCATMKMTEKDETRNMTGGISSWWVIFQHHMGIWYGNGMEILWKWYDISWDQQSKNKQPFNSSQHLDFCSSKIGSVPGGFINIGIASISQSVWIPRTMTHKPCSDHGCKYDWGYFRLFHERIIVMSQVCNVCWLWRQVFNPPKVLLTESCMNGGDGWNSPGLQAMDSFRS